MTRRSGACVGLLLLLLSPLCASAAGPKRVLILDPYERDVAPFSTVASAFRSALARDLGEPVEFYEIPLDLARFAGPEGEGPLVAFLEGRIKSHPVDLVVPIGGMGLQFAARNRERLFPDTPILVVSGDPRLIPPDFLRTNANVVTQKVNLSGMIEDILQLQPQTTNIVVVFGASALENFWVSECRREFQSFTNRVGFTWLNGLSLDEIAKRCAALPPRSFILHGLFVVDGAGIPFEQNAALRRLHQVANAPLFAYFASELGLGPIGGRLYPDSEIGAQSARTAIRILRGERPESIPPQVFETAAPVYDWRELRRWRIPEARLPAGSIIEFRQPTFWKQYRWHILMVVLFCCLQTALVIGLVVNRIRRRRGEAMATLIADLSSKFINLPPGEVDQEIEDAQRRVCEYLGLDLSALWQWTDETPRCFKMTHLYRPLGGPPIPEQFDAQEAFPWCLKQLLEGKVISLSSIESENPEAARDLESWRHYGIKSNLTFPLSAGGGQLVGALSFNTMREERVWSEEIVTRLQLVAQIFGNALARKRADQELRVSEERFRNIAVNLPGVVYQFYARDNGQRGLYYVAGQVREVCGLEAEPLDTFFGRFTACVAPEDRQRWLDSIEEAVRTFHPWEQEVRFIKPGGGEIYIRAFSQPKRQANEVVASGVIRDITERKRLDLALAESEARFSLLANTAPVLIWVSGPDKLCTFFNQPWLDFTGRTLEQELGNGWTEGVHPEDLAAAMKTYNESFDARLSFTMDYRLRRHNGRYRWITDHGVPRYDTRRNFLGYIGSCADVTERRQAEAEVQQRRAELAHMARVSTLGALAGTLAHELNQPLNAILNNAQAGSRFLAGKVPDLGEVRGALEDIAQDTKRASEVIRQIRALVKKDEPKFQPLDLNRIITEVVRLLHSDSLVRKVRMALELDSGLPPAQGDSVQVQQVVLNLLLNAFDAMKEVPEGERTVRLRTRQPDAVSLQVSIGDRGPGVSPERLVNLFEPFRSSKREGLGLGLSISHSIIAAHGGRLWVENNPGRGATFYFTLPVHEANPKPG
jgi:PAS domain S-box-containing protein